MTRAVFCACLLLTALPAAAERLAASVLDPAGAPVEDAVVVAVGALPVAPTADRAAVENQVNKQFVPRVLAVQVGTRVFFPNEDHVRHHVYSFSPAKRFELPLYAGVGAPPVQFDRPGPVTLGCNIHDWMRGYIYVAESPWFGRTDASGHTAFDLPAGRYTVRAWHPQLAVDEQSTARVVDVAAGAEATLQFKLELKPALRPRRAPIGDGGGYR